MSPEDTSLKDKLDQLAAFEPTPLPVISLYLNTEAGQNGKGQFEQFVRKEFPLRQDLFSSLTGAGEFRSGLRTNQRLPQDRATTFREQSGAFRVFCERQLL